MPSVVSIHGDVRAWLNDVNGIIFNDATLLPFTKLAYQELQDELALNGIGDTFEDESDAIGVGPNVARIPASGAPADMIAPITIFQSDVVTTLSNWEPMEEGNWEPGDISGARLSMWKWKEGEIKLKPTPVGGPTNYIKIRYYKLMTALVDSNSNIPIVNCVTFLSKRVAAIAALVIGGNLERAGVLDTDAQRSLKTVVAILVKRNQGQPTRRQPFRAP